MTWCPVASRERGSTVLLVLAMLTILLLLGIAFSYSSRLETQASSNYAQLTQARTSAATGLPMALPLLAQASQGITTNLQSWNTVPQDLRTMVHDNGKSSRLTASDMAQLRKAGMAISKNKDGDLESGPQADVAIRDLSGLINLNAVPDAATMERLVSVALPGGNSKVKSNVLLALRGEFAGGAAAQPGRGGQAVSKDDNEDRKNLDPRDPSAVLIDNLDRLKLGARTGRAAFTDEEITKLSQIVTIFSQAPEVYNAPDGTHIPRIALDDVDPKVVYDTLRRAFPGKKKELLLQFAANVADFSDADNEVTTLDQDGNRITSATQSAAPGSDLNLDTAGSNRVLGVEMTPRISEVYPDAATSVGFDDDGQFVEIVNPWNKSISLAGWTLRLGNGATVALSATLPAGGYLIVTDNYNSPKPDSPPGHGSVVSLFGATANGTTKQFMIFPALDLPDRNSKVSLYDANGNLADSFSYGSTGQVDGKSSFQRRDSLVRGYSTLDATPMAPAAGGAINAEAMAATTKAWEQDGNTTMTKLSQLFAISTGFAENRPAGTLGSNAGTVHGGQVAELHVPEQTGNGSTAEGSDGIPDNLDLRLIDVFTATPRNVANSSAYAEDSDGNETDGRSAYDAFRRKMERLKERGRQVNGQSQADASVTTGPVYSYGKLNVNTCGKYALLGLDLDSALAGGNVTGVIEQFEGHRLTQAQRGSSPFTNVSDFVKQFIPNLSRSNLEVLDKVTDEVTVGSSAFEITATNRLSDKEQKALDGKSNASGPRPATATASWVISTDTKPYSIVHFALTP